MDQQQLLDESIANTKASIQSACHHVIAATTQVNNNGNFPSIFTDESILRRPPFTYIHALVKFFVQHKSCCLNCWKELLFNNDANLLADQSSTSLSSRKEQLIFITRLLALVSQVTGKQYSILVSPSNILCGIDVISTLEFLQSLASIVVLKDIEDDVLTNAVQYVLEVGDTNLYKQGVRTRKGFVRLQAICRGLLVRRRYNKKNVEKESTNTTINGVEVNAKVEDECSTNSSDDTTQLTAPNQKSIDEEQKVLLESYEAMISRKAKVEEEIAAAEKRLKRENDKLIRMLNLGVKHKTTSNISSTNSVSIPRRPLSAPVVETSKKNELYSKIDTVFADTITNFSERQRAIKQKERQIDERSSRLRQSYARSKQKEIELRLQEERINNLSGKLRNQQLQLKEQKLQFERSKLLQEEQPSSLIEETPRPCVLCTEKKIKLREIRTKIRQRNRVLSRREKDVISRAHELRRREVQIAKREKVLSDKENEQCQQSSTATAVASDTTPLPPPLPPSPSVLNTDDESEHDISTTPSTKNEEEEKMSSIKTTLPAVQIVRRDTSSNLSIKLKHPRKRRRRGHGNNMNSIDRDSMRASFKQSTPTIVEEEETPADNDNDQCVVNDGESVGECSVDREEAKVSNNSEIIDIHKARQSLGLVKVKGRDSTQGNNEQPWRSRMLKHQQQQDEHIVPSQMVSSSPHQSITPKRHVFAFEAAVRPQGSRGTRQSTRDKDRRKQTDLDIQMNIAMSRLTELM